MIGKILPHKAQFGRRTSYALYEKDGATQRDRWTVMRNLDGLDPELSHVVMAATAKGSRRVKLPCGHMILSWAHQDDVDDDTMVGIVDQTVADLGLAEHQAIYVAHDDTQHRHVHVVYNRVHPETYKVASDSHERMILRRSLMRQEQEHELTQTPLTSKGRHLRPQFSDIEIARREQTEPQVRLSKKRCDQLREELAYCFTAALGWSSFHGMLKRRGYDLAKAGPGVRIVRHHLYAKLSDVLPPKLKAKKLIQRWGSFGDYWEALEQPALQQRRKQRRRQKQRSKDDFHS